MIGTPHNKKHATFPVADAKMFHLLFSKKKKTVLSRGNKNKSWVDFIFTIYSSGFGDPRVQPRSKNIHKLCCCLCCFGNTLSRFLGARLRKMSFIVVCLCCTYIYVLNCPLLSFRFALVCMKGLTSSKQSMKYIVSRSIRYFAIILYRFLWNYVDIAVKLNIPSILFLVTG